MKKLPGYERSSMTVLIGKETSQDDRQIAAMVTIDYHPEVISDIAVRVALETACGIINRHLEDYLADAERTKN